METVLAGLRECWPAVGYRVLDSQYFGVPQRRRRVFFVGGPDAERVATVLALTEGGAGDLATGHQAGADAAPRPRVGVDLARALGGIGGGQDYGANKGTLVSAPEIAYALAAGVGARFGSGRDAQDTFVTSGVTVAQPLRSNVYNNSDPGMEASMHLATGGTVRRLTPVECERLQGFPDGWTCMCQPLTAYAADPDAAALRCTCPDSPRYRALGNAVTTNVVFWIGERLLRYGDAA